MKSTFLTVVIFHLGVLSSPWIGGAQNFGPWQIPANLGSIVNSACNDMHPTISNDGLTLIFSSNRPFDHVATSTTDCLPALHLWGTQRLTADGPWSAPRPLTINMPATSLYEDHASNLTADGHWLLFHSQRPGDATHPSCNGGGYRELWASHRRDKTDLLGWGPPVNLGCTLNVPFADDAGPNIWEDSDGRIVYLYFTRDLTPLGPGSDVVGNGFDVYVSTCASDLSACIMQQRWNAAAFEANLSSPLRDTRTGIRRRDGLEMLITSNRVGSVGGLDLWVSTRASTHDSWSTPLNLNLDIADKGGTSAPNTTANDGGASISWNGETMFFYSTKPGGYGGSDLYVITRQKLQSAN